MSDMDAEFARMNAEDASLVKSKYKKKTASVVIEEMPVSKVLKVKKLDSNSKVSNTKKVPSKASKTDNVGNGIVNLTEKVLVSYEEMKIKLNRDVNASGEDNSRIRREAMERMNKILFLDHDMSSEDYSKIFRDVCKNIFKRYADSVEKCRELAQVITQHFFEKCLDFSAILGYYFPALMQRLPSGMAYDDDMKVFVVDMEAHEAYRRGKALNRQDKVGVVGAATHQVVESSEAIRFLTCSAVHTLVKQVKEIGNCTVLHAYFQDIVMFVQAQLRDPFPDLKALACSTLELLATIEDFEIGMKLYAVGLVRGILPVLRHRHSRVRLAAITALRFVMIVPDRAKRKAAGSDAITDMVGFREENVLQIAAFYVPDVQVNYLAELVNDKSAQVRERLVELLTDLLTVIGDRYDHQTRLLPYLLDLLTDDTEVVSRAALSCLATCGKQYEEEHFDEVVDRRQYGVDGDARINLDKPFPPPFQERPRLGMRLYVRGNTKRFLSALVNELTNWVSQTRMKSAHLLKMVIVLCEEHLTMEIHTLLPSLVKALRFARDDEDSALHSLLLEMFELLGRYILPEVYIFYLLPRLRGDADVVQFGMDAESRITVMEFLQALLEGSKPSLIPPHFEEIVKVLTDPFIISQDSVKLQLVALDVLTTTLHSMKGKSNAVVEAQFVATGRLANLNSTIRSAFKFLLLDLSHPELHDKALVALTALCDLEFDGNNISEESGQVNSGILRLFRQHGVALFNRVESDYELDSTWTVAAPDHVLLSRLVESPNCVLQSDNNAFSKLLGLLCRLARESGTVSCAQETEEAMLYAFSELLVAALRPVDRRDIFRITGKVVGKQFTAESENAARLLDVALPPCAYDEQHLESVMTAFVLDLRWSRSAKLQLQRLELLRVLLTANNSSSDADSAAALLQSQQLLRFAGPIFDSLLVAASAPANPVGLRLGALDVSLDIISSIAEHAGLSRLKSFAHWSSTSSSAEINSSGLRLQSKLSAQKAVTTALAMLDDSQDQVRIEALRLVTAAVRLLLSDAECAQASGQTGVQFATVVTRLLAQLTIANCTGTGLTAETRDPFVDHLDVALRAAAVLDPDQFELLVREQLGRSTTDGSSSADYCEVLSGLISHVDVLRQFTKQ